MDDIYGVWEDVTEFHHIYPWPMLQQNNFLASSDCSYVNAKTILHTSTKEDYLKKIIYLDMYLCVLYILVDNK
jgi:hypothetical protein